MQRRGFVAGGAQAVALYAVSFGVYESAITWRRSVAQESVRQGIYYRE